MSATTGLHEATADTRPSTSLATISTMRFLRLSNLFHRRSKSDGDLANMRREPMETLPYRPASANGIDELVLASTYPLEVEVSPLFAQDAGVSVELTHPIPLVTPSLHAVDCQPGFIFPELKQRIHELESTLNHQYRANRRISALERALTESRAALESAYSASGVATSEASALRTRLIQTQRALYTALTSAPTSDNRARILAAENAALAAERVRYHRFIELLISAGIHKNVLSRAYDDVFAGADPEEALVAAIREALEKPNSPWIALLEPIIGQRTPEEYKAQVGATLDARKDARRWRKKAKWWKGRVVETGAKDLITPSPSDISSIVEELSEERRRALGELKDRRQGGKIEYLQAENSQAPLQPHKAFSSVRHSSPPLASVLMSSLVNGDSAEVGTARISTPPVVAIVPMPTSSSAEYPRLAPLASQVFRESMSQTSSLHTHSGRSSVSYPPSLSTSFSFPRFKMAAGVKESSSSSSSISSTRSRRRRVEVMAVPPTTQTNLGAPTAKTDPAAVPPLAKLAYIHEESEPEPTPPIATPSRPSALPSYVQCMRTPSPSPRFQGRAQPSSLGLVPAAHETPSDPEQDSDDELVFVMHSDAVHTLRNTPVHASAPFTPMRSQHEFKGKATPSPEGKSRLPVLKKAMRRLSMSISKPVLVDTTNAATFTFTRTRPLAKGVKEAPKTVGTKKKVVNAPIKTGTGSPSQANRVHRSGVAKKGGVGLILRGRKSPA
ncbi:hypothetical protein C8Q72DRAFT_849260 [Fomitopsis betulina]|nr:hypothetical protein C8Q72DRAFT_849260 [Fomitopsis betulina]